MIRDPSRCLVSDPMHFCAESHEGARITYKGVSSRSEKLYPGTQDVSRHFDGKRERKGASPRQLTDKDPVAIAAYSWMAKRKKLTTKEAVTANLILGL